MTIPSLFDQRQMRRNRDRTARGEAANALRQHLGMLLGDRLALIKRRFGRGLLLGVLPQSLGIVAADHILCCDPSLVVLSEQIGTRVQAGIEALPFAPASFDLILIGGLLHWVDDLPGVLAQLRALLVPDGLLLAAFPGDDSLSGLRHSLMAAEAAVTGGAGQRIMPMVDVRSAGQLLQRAGFAMPVADVEHVQLSHADPLALLRDLHDCGEANALRQRTPLRRDVLAAALADHGQRSGADGRLLSRFAIVLLTGWAPADGQPKPLRPGSGKVSLAAVLDPSSISFAQDVQAGSR
jgi:NADH dehydrogenase [ubiquinone] 1 alpha subcomplex assembly factor 5